MTKSTGSNSNDGTDRSAAAATAPPPIAPVHDSSTTDAPPAAGAVTEPFLPEPEDQVPIKAWWLPACGYHPLTEQLLPPRGEGGEGWWASVGAFLTAERRDMVSVMMVDVVSTVVAMGAFGGEVYLITGGKAKSVCSPYEKALPSPVVALANLLPLLAVIMAPILCIIHTYPCSYPLCTTSTLTLIQLYAIAVFGGWIAGCLGGMGAGDVLLGMLVFIVLATLAWAWQPVLRVLRALFFGAQEEGGRQEQEGDMEGAEP